MQFSYAAVAAVLATAVAAGGNGTYPVWVTDVVTVLTTVCPAATTLTFNGQTYTATASETITITNCPCTVSKPVYTTPVVSVTPVYVNSTAAPPAVSTTPVAPAGTGAATTTPQGPAFTGAANKAVAGSAAGLAGLLGLAAYIL